MFSILKKQMFVFLGLIIFSSSNVKPSVQREDLPPEVIAYPDMVLYNGTVLSADEKFTTAEAVAVRDGKVLVLGSTERVLKLAGPNTVRIDLEGNTVVPGFIETHSMGVWGSHSTRGIDYLGNYSRIRFESLEDGLGKIAETVEKANPGEWVFVGAYPTAAAHRLTRVMLDEISPRNPLLVSLGMHLGFLNSKALAYIPDDVKAGVFKDRNGQPTGKIAGWAYGVLTYEILPFPEGAAFEEMVQKLKDRLTTLNAMGVTSGGTRASGLVITLLRELYVRGELPMRMRVSSEIARLNPHTERYLKRVGNLMDVGDEWFKIGGMTVSSIDGTATKGAGLTRKPKREMFPWDAYGPYGEHKFQEMVEEGKDWREYSDYKSALLVGFYGWNVSDMDVIGDGAVELALEIFDKINKKRPIKGRRFGMVHGPMRPLDLARRLAEYDSILSFDPSYLFLGKDYVSALEKQYGEDAVAAMVPLRDLIDLGLKPILEVVGTSCLAGMEAFITRKNEATGKGYGPDQRITREEALKMQTAWAARFYGDEKIIGTIEPGKLADLVILGGDYMAVPEEEISELPVLKVIVGGKITFEKK